MITLLDPKSEEAREIAGKLAKAAETGGADVLLDDRDVRPGFMFADMELIGIPHRVVVGERSLDEGKVEYRGRTQTENSMIDLQEIRSFLVEALQSR